MKNQNKVILAIGLVLAAATAVIGGRAYQIQSSPEKLELMDSMEERAQVLEVWADGFWMRGAAERAYIMGMAAGVREAKVMLEQSNLGESQVPVANIQYREE